MVFVFLRFGKPLEDDDLKLVREKIISIHINRETERLDPVKSALKKHDELRKLANIEIALSLQSIYGYCARSSDESIKPQDPFFGYDDEFKHPDVLRSEPSDRASADIFA